MPTLLSTHEIKLEWADLETWRQRPVPESARRRSSGVHLSGIIRYVLGRLGKLGEEDRGDEMPVVVGVGMAWENWVVGLREFEGMVWQPGEWRVDGVAGTPDGLSQIDGRRVLEEIKFTLKSEHTHGKDGQVLKEAIWMWQLAANCYALSQVLAEDVTLARLTVMWERGDYRPPWPKLMQYVVGFGVGELEELWRNVIVRNRDAKGVVREVHDELAT